MTRILRIFYLLRAILVKEPPCAHDLYSPQPILHRQGLYNRCSTGSQRPNKPQNDKHFDDTRSRPARLSSCINPNPDYKRGSRQVSKWWLKKEQSRFLDGKRNIYRRLLERSLKTAKGSYRLAWRSCLERVFTER